MFTGLGASFVLWRVLFLDVGFAFIHVKNVSDPRRDDQVNEKRHAERLCYGGIAAWNWGLSIASYRALGSRVPVGKQERVVPEGVPRLLLSLLLCSSRNQDHDSLSAGRLLHEWSDDVLPSAPPSVGLQRAD